MDWKLITVLSFVLCVTAHPPRAAKSEQSFIKYFGKEEKVNAENNNSERQEEYVESNPFYEFSYKVSDPHTHDFKGQHEKRHGDKVNGDYWLIQPDGLKRLVKYHANDHIGFNVLIDYSLQGHEAAKSKGNDESNSENENEQRTWHVIHDYKMKKTSKEDGASEISSGQSKENAESGQTESQDQQNSQQNEAQEIEKSQNSQEGRKESTEKSSNERRKEHKWNEKRNRQENRRENSNEQQTSGQIVNSKESSNNEMSGEKIYWYRIPYKYLKKGYEVNEELKEESRKENEETNEGGGSKERMNEQSAEKSNEENRPNEVNKNSGEKNSARQESSENGSKEKVFGYKSYVYHIRH